MSTEVVWDSNVTRVYNRLENNKWINNKKDLFLNLSSYYRGLGKDPYDHIPETYLIHKGYKDPSFVTFLDSAESSAVNDSTNWDSSDSEEKKPYWIIKPGENTNRGKGIKVCETIAQLKQYMDSYPRSYYIIQKYISNPLLIEGRKFDIRWFGLFTCINGVKKGYFYQGGYLRTSCKEFTLNDIHNNFVHLTNDAIQHKSSDYGKHENCNKLSFSDFDKYLEAKYQKKSFYKWIYPKLKRLVTDVFMSSSSKLNPENKQHWFELYGFDMMVDEKLKVYLIEVNTNPCLETPCSLLSSVISSVLDHTFRVSLDVLFPNPTPQQGKL